MNQASKPLTPNLIEKLYQNGLINEGTRRESQSFLQGSRQWKLWIERLFLGLGTALILASIMFFFAYNWEDLGQWLQFALVEAAILICLIASLYPFKAKLINQTLMLAASFLVGVLLALIGQTYQTGANAWQLFAVWAVVIFPWVCLSKFAAHWALWLTVANLALYFWMDQTLHLTRYETLLVPAAHALLNGAALASLLYARKTFTWLQGPWTLRILCLVFIINLCILAIQCIFHRHLFTSWPLLVALVTITAQALLFYLSRFKWQDFITHALLIISLAIQLETGIMKSLTSSFKAETGILLIGSIVTLAVFAGLISYLKATHHKMGEEQ